MKLLAKSALAVLLGVSLIGSSVSAQGVDQNATPYYYMGPGMMGGCYGGGCYVNPNYYMGPGMMMGYWGPYGYSYSPQTVQPGNTTVIPVPNTSLGQRLNYLQNTLNLNADQQTAFNNYAQAQESLKDANQQIAQLQGQATTAQQRLDARIQGLKVRVNALENLSKARKALLSTLNPQQANMFDLVETNPTLALPN